MYSPFTPRGLTVCRIWIQFFVHFCIQLPHWNVFQFLKVKVIECLACGFVLCYLVMVMLGVLVFISGPTRTCNVVHNKLGIRSKIVTNITFFFRMRRCKECQSIVNSVRKGKCICVWYEKYVEMCFNGANICLD